MLSQTEQAKIIFPLNSHIFAQVHESEPAYIYVFRTVNQVEAVDHSESSNEWCYPRDYNKKIFRSEPLPRWQQPGGG